MTKSKQRITYKLNINLTQCQNQIIIQSFNANINNIILSEIQQKLKQSQICLKIDIPSISNTDRQNLTGKIETVAQTIKGRVISGQSIDIEIFKNKEKKVLDLIKSLETIKYPKKWTAQGENYIKILLDKNSKEYNKIKTIFQKTDRGTIKAIFWIQNKAFYDNYYFEKKKLKDVCQKQQKLLLLSELKRYIYGMEYHHNTHQQYIRVWMKLLMLHIVEQQNYSKLGWIMGIRYTYFNQFVYIYFAENAAYSRNYSYQIKLQDDPQYAGNLVFLCCLVTTGRAEERDIKKPSDGNDCVTDFQMVATYL